MRVIDADGNQAGVLTIAEALQLAQDVGLDLVEISPNVDPPVCRVMDYGKYIFEQNKRKTAQKKKQKQIQVKEIKFRPATDVGDYQVKVKKILAFLEEGDKVKITLRFRGREVQHQELGTDLLQRLQLELKDVAVVEQEPRLEGRQIVMMVGPKREK